MPSPSLGAHMTPIGTRSTCGNQVRSTMASNPAYSMGTSTRDSVAKRFISDEHKEKDNDWAKMTPGPGQYKVKPVTSTKQPDSKIRTEPNYPFTTAQRFTKDKEAAGVPGPGAYVV